MAFNLALFGLGADDLCVYVCVCVHLCGKFKINKNIKRCIRKEHIKTLICC